MIFSHQKKRFHASDWIGLSFQVFTSVKQCFGRIQKIFLYTYIYISIYLHLHTICRFFLVPIVHHNIYIRTQITFLRKFYQYVLYTMGPPKPTVLEVFAVNNLVFRWPKPLFFMVLGAHGTVYIYIW